MIEKKQAMLMSRSRSPRKTTGQQITPVDAMSNYSSQGKHPRCKTTINIQPDHKTKLETFT
jgi:hypothetical protein